MSSRCRHCRSHGRETFHYMQRRYVFDVDRARELVSDGRESVELDEADARFFVHTSRIRWDHVPHVDLSIPGIVAHIFFTTNEGEFVRAQILIDGHHRAARALDLGQPFLVHVLSEDESEAILLKAPAGARRPAASRAPRRPTRRSEPVRKRAASRANRRR